MGKNQIQLAKKKKGPFKPSHGQKVRRATKFIHPLTPRYNIAAKALKRVLKFEEPIETVECIQGSKLNIEAGKLTKLTLERIEEVDYLLEKMKLMKKPDLNLWQLRILAAELLWGTQTLTSASQMVVITRKYETDYRESFVEVSTVIRNPIDKDKLLFPTYVRINTLSITIENSIAAFAKEGWNHLPRCKTYLDHLRTIKNLKENNFIRDFHISELFVFPSGTSFYEHPGYLKGKFLIQDKGSCLSSFLLNPKPGSVVLDMCAAVGVKTNHLANIMNNTGLIYANDINEERMTKMNRLMQLTDVKCVKMAQKSYSTKETYKTEDVKYILIDPDNTYSGLFLHADKSKQRKRIAKYKIKQNTALRYALQKFPNVKRIVYTVCSIYPDEGEWNVNQVLNEVGHSYSLLNVREMLWNEWQSVNHSDLACNEKCLAIRPEFDLCQGYFIAVFERDFSKPVPDYVPKTEFIIRKSYADAKPKNVTCSDEINKTIKLLDEIDDGGSEEIESEEDLDSVAEMESIEEIDLSENEDSLEHRKPTEYNKQTEQSKPIEQKKMVAYNKPTEYRAPMEKKRPVDNRVPMENNRPMEYNRPVEYRAPMENMEYRAPMENNRTMEYRAPMETNRPMEYRAPMENNRPIEYRVPMENNRTMEYRAPFENNKPMEYRAPMEINRSMEYRVPIENNRPMDYREPMEYRVPIENNRPMEYRVPMQNNRPIQYTVPMENNRPMEYRMENSRPMQNFTQGRRIPVVENSNRNKQSLHNRGFNRPQTYGTNVGQSQQHLPYSYQTSNPVAHSAASTSNYYEPQQIYETTHDQLYP